MRNEYYIFAPFICIVYMMLTFVILVGVWQNIGEWVDYIDYLIGMLYTIYRGDY